MDDFIFFCAVNNGREFFEQYRDMENLLMGFFASRERKS